MGGKEIYNGTKRFPTKLVEIGLIKSVIFVMLMIFVISVSFVT